MFLIIILLDDLEPTIFAFLMTGFTVNKLSLKENSFGFKLFILFEQKNWKEKKNRDKKVIKSAIIES